MVAELVRRRVAVIAAKYSGGASGESDDYDETADDPVANGLVKSLNRPAGNATDGVTINGYHFGLHGCWKNQEGR
jgi:hypothetical protein